LGISKLFPETIDAETIHSIIYSRLGRSFNFNQKTGINLDLGIMFSNVSETLYYSPMWVASHPGFSSVKGQYDALDLRPSLSISFFIKL
jgi:hypothetical protein